MKQLNKLMIKNKTKVAVCTRSCNKQLIVQKRAFVVFVRRTHQMYNKLK